ncbi:MAG TPA: hypothetical protein PLL59_00090 [Chitinophagales bacterium]|nr:hypothetical protein [Chitinophagales bacterium]
MKSRIAFILIVIVYFTSFFYYKSYRNFLQGGGDPWGYYAYLPALFIYDDLHDLQKTIGKRAEYNASSVRTLENAYLQIEEAHAFKHNTIIKYTNGVAILYSPFFFAAHFFCKSTNLYAADGYTLPYNIAVGFATIFYSLFGLWILRKLLSKYFSDSISAIVLMSIAIGTNLYFFSVSHLGMSHVFLFALYALCLWATDCYYHSFKTKYAIAIGLACGMITLIRPNEIIILLFPFLWNVYSIDTFRERIETIRTHVGQYVLMTLLFLIVLLPQFLYWKILSGNFIFYSYTKEGFDFLHPHIKEGILGFANGWLSYTPILFFAVIGLFFLHRNFKNSALPSFLFLPIYIWVIYSWWCWQYINGFGSRPMIETYPIWAFPMAVFFTVIGKKIGLKTLSLALVCFFIFLNIFQTWQFKAGLLWTEDSNFAHYRASFLQSKGSYNAHIAFDSREYQPDSNKLQFVKTIQTQSFDDSFSNSFNATIYKSSPYAFELKEGTTPAIQIPANTAGVQALDYFKISCWVYCPALQYDHYKQAVIAAEFVHNGAQIRWRPVRLQTKIDNPNHHLLHAGKTKQWQYISFFVRAPHRYKDERDILKVFVWNPSEVPIMVDDIQIALWKKIQ